MGERYPEKTDSETARTIREWTRKPGGPFSWPTDGCGYKQHMRFVRWRNERYNEWDGVASILAYAELLERGEIAPFREADRE